MKKNKKTKNDGFSLVELIIVIAIMVALVAVMAPRMIKYIDKARNAAVTGAAEQCSNYIKVEYGDTIAGEGTVRIGRGKTNREKMELTFEDIEGRPNTFIINGKTGADGLAEFKNAVGFTDGKVCKTDLVYLIHIKYYDIGNHPTLSTEIEADIVEETTYESVN